MSRYIVQVRKAGPEWLNAGAFTYKWVASLYGARMLREAWQVRIVPAATTNPQSQERGEHGK